MRLTLLVVYAVALVPTLACAVRGPTATEAHHRAGRRAPVTSTRDVLGADELRRASGSNALEIIQELRPRFLRSRGPLHAPTVFVDGFRQGGTDTLRQTSAWDIAEIRYLDSGDATQRFGAGYTGGVIHILTVRPK